MKKDLPATPLQETTTQSTGNDTGPQPRRAVQRRSFLKGLGVAGAALSAGALLATQADAEEKRSSITQGDAAILRFLAAAEILETDLWQQYNELGGIQDSEVPGGSGSPLYALALTQLDGDMPQYIHDNTEEEVDRLVDGLRSAGGR